MIQLDDSGYSKEQISDYLLLSYNIADNDKLRYIEPSFERDIHNAYDMLGVEKAVDRILKAISLNEKIAIYSDYDCDGIPGGVLLREGFRNLGIETGIHIPNRNREGYGLHNEALLGLKNRGYSVIITVDLGITNLEQAIYAKDIGLDLIITDHHLPIRGEDGTQQIPDAYCVINPKQDDCMYKEKMLCGCAVAYKLICALYEKVRQSDSDNLAKIKSSLLSLGKSPEKWLLDLVAISTIADMVPLTGENWTLAHFGLKVLRRTRRPGIRRLVIGQKMSLDHINETDIGFTIAPRINAASRLGEAYTAHEFLLSSDIREGENLYRKLDDLNEERKSLVLDGHDIIKAMNLEKDKFILVGHESFESGVLGLIASKILEEHKVPVFVYGKSVDGVVKGSCRAENGTVNMVHLMHLCKDALEHYGGHEAAGGFAFNIKNEKSFRELLNRNLEKALDAYQMNPREETASPVVVANLHHINKDLYDSLNFHSPFGQGRPKPVIQLNNAKPASARLFGKQDNHIEITFKEDGQVFKTISFFNGPDIINDVREREAHNIYLEWNSWNGAGELRGRLV